ncbi:MAG: type II toxin-antitoxin system VapC family toxin [Acidobacteriaceae bacterium]
MRVLLDTHAFIWWANDDPLLSVPAREALSEVANEIYLSSVTPWEMSIKIALGKLTLGVPLREFVRFQVNLYGFIPLQINYDHAYRVGMLPPHHGDPFDRLLIAQAIEENLVLVTRDEKFAPYGISTLW